MPRSPPKAGTGPWGSRVHSSQAYTSRLWFGLRPKTEAKEANTAALLTRSNEDHDDLDLRRLYEAKPEKTVATAEAQRQHRATGEFRSDFILF